MRIVDPRGAPEPVPRVTPDHWVTAKNTIVAGVMSLLTAAAGIIGSHVGGATKDDVDHLTQAIAARALDDATAHSALWVQLNAIQQRQYTVDPSPPPRGTRRAKRPDAIPAKPADPAP